MKDENSALHAKSEAAKPVALAAISFQSAASAMKAAPNSDDFYLLWGFTFFTLLRSLG